MSPPPIAEFQTREQLKKGAVQIARATMSSLGDASSPPPTPTRPSPMVSRSSSRAFAPWPLPIRAIGARPRRESGRRRVVASRLRRAAPRIFRNSQNWGLTGGACFRNILTCARRFRAVWRESSVGVSSNGRTAVSGAVCEGSTPSTPAIFSRGISWLRRLAV